MLTALEQGVKGDVWFRLIDKVWSERNLLASYNKVAENDGAPGVDHVTVEEFGRQLESQLTKLTTALHEGTYQPQADPADVHTEARQQRATAVGNSDGA